MSWVRMHLQDTGIYFLLGQYLVLYAALLSCLDYCFYSYFFLVLLSMANKDSFIHWFIHSYHSDMKWNERQLCVQLNLKWKKVEEFFVIYRADVESVMLQNAVKTVGSHKFLPLIYQLAARMSRSVNNFQTVLHQVCLSFFKFPDAAELYSFVGWSYWCHPLRTPVTHPGWSMFGKCLYSPVGWGRWWA